MPPCLDFFFKVTLKLRNAEKKTIIMVMNSKACYEISS